MNPRALLLTLMVGGVALSPAGALERPTLEFGTGLVYGQSYELVLRDGTFNDPVSRLIWPTALSATLEAGATEAWNSWTTTTVHTTVAWPVLAGQVVDEDWRYYSLIYGHSTHTTQPAIHIEADLRQGFQWNGWSCELGGRYRWTSWEAWNGSGDYTKTSGKQHDDFTGAVLDYRQMWLIPYVGVGWTTETPWGLWSLAGRFSPWTWCQDRDDHNYSAVQSTYPVSTLMFVDQVSGGLFGEAELGWDSGAGWGVRARGSSTYNAVGSTTTVYTTETPSTAYSVSPNAAGAWFWETSLTFFVRN